MEKERLNQGLSLTLSGFVIRLLCPKSLISLTPLSNNLDFPHARYNTTSLQLRCVFSLLVHIGFSLGITLLT